MRTNHGQLLGIERDTSNPLKIHPPNPPAFPRVLYVPHSFGFPSTFPLSSALERARRRGEKETCAGGHTREATSISRARAGMCMCVCVCVFTLNRCARMQFADNKVEMRLSKIDHNAD